MTIKALIPVRAGSSPIKNKNICPFAGSKLFEIKIRSLQQINMLNGIIVNSDSDEMLALADRFGCETVKSDVYYAQTNTSGNDYFENISVSFNGDVIVMTAVTNPLLQSKTIDDTIEKFFDAELLYKKLRQGD